MPDILWMMDVHWKQVRGTRGLSIFSIRALRSLGSSALVASLLFCLFAEVPTMTALMLSAMTVAFILTWPPHLLRILRPRGET